MNRYALILALVFSLTAFAGLPGKYSPKKTAVDFQSFEQQIDQMESMTYQELMSAFEYVRDTKFYQTTDSTTKRRIPWLYINEGCQARAHASALEIAKKFGDLPFKTVFIIKKMFKRGSLKAVHDLLGYSMGWLDFHVALAAKVGNEVYMIDPPFDFKKPITFTKWRESLLSSISQKSVKYALCDRYSFDVGYGNCQKGDLGRFGNYVENEMLGGQRPGFLGYLKLEEQTLEKGIEEGRYSQDKEFYLGETPPWQ